MASQMCMHERLPVRMSVRGRERERADFAANHFIPSSRSMQTDGQPDRQAGSLQGA